MSIDKQLWSQVGLGRKMGWVGIAVSEPNDDMMALLYNSFPANVN